MKIKLVKSMANWPDNDCYGQVDKNYIRDLVRMNAIIDGAERHGMNYE